jgi:F-type H+-transporting ATPase subunit b
MDATLHALGQILLRAVPTFILVVVLHFYLKFIFFRPMRKILAQRYEASEGARKLADLSLERASAKAAEYQAALRRATGEVYEANEKLVKELGEQHEAAVREAREDAEKAIRAAKEDLAREVEAAKEGLGRDTDLLANKIVEALLSRRAA